MANLKDEGLSIARFPKYILMIHNHVPTYQSISFSQFCCLKKSQVQHLDKRAYFGVIIASLPF